MKDNLTKNILYGVTSTQKSPLFLQEALQAYYQQRVEKSWHGGHILKGKAPDEHSIRLENNDYLGLSTHPDIVAAMRNALEQHGTGQMQSIVFHIHNQQLKDCESVYANWLQKESCLFSQSGWCANIGLIQALAKPHVPVYIDYYAHMSLWEGALCANAKPIPFAHNNIDSLHKRIQRFGPGIIAVDSIYSTNGAISPLEKYVEIAKQYNCLLIIDESHALGVKGPCGNGLVAEAGLSEEVDIISASLSKAIAGRGGLISGDQHILELVRFNARPTIFSTALMPHDLSGFSQSLTIIKQERWRQQSLQKMCDYMHKKLLQININVAPSQTQIIPLLCGSEQDTIWLRNNLEEANIYGAVFCYPATPQNKSLIRLSLTVNHTKQEIDYVCDCLADLKKKGGDLPFYR